MEKLNFRGHNEEVQRVWDSFCKGNPERIPMIIGVNPRYLILDPKYNKKSITFYDYFNDPEVMWNMQLEFAEFMALNMPSDRIMGIPEDGWKVNIDFQNTYEASWLGCQIIYPENNVPTTKPYLDDENKNELLEKGIPDPFSGIMGIAKRYYEIFNEKIDRGCTYKGIPVTQVTRVMGITDGIFTVACNLRGTDKFCIDLYEDIEYVLKMMELITDAVILRVKAWRRLMGQNEMSSGLVFADDSIALLSDECYKEFVMSFHKKLISELSDNTGDNAIHLCGNASHLFKTLINELNIKEFDTGFPFKHGEIIKQLGPDIVINGGPHIDILQFGTHEEINAETKRIIDEVKPLTKKFIMREANNISPKTPLENVAAMYSAVKKYGSY